MIGLGCFHFARHYSGNHCCFLFLCLLRCFSSARSRIYATILQIVRFPHSEIAGSIHICWSPALIAAYHVLHRLWEPRHPPCTLSYFLLRYRLLLGMYAFLICCPFIGSLVHWFIGITTPLPLKSCSFKAKQRLYLLSSLLFTSSNMSKNFLSFWA
jgi:hypothetical protein